MSTISSELIKSCSSGSLKQTSSSPTSHDVMKKLECAAAMLTSDKPVRFTLPASPQASSITYPSLPPEPSREFLEGVAFPYLLSLLNSPSLPLRLHGWDYLTAQIRRSACYRQPPMHYDISGAGLDWLNGRYDLSNPLSPVDGLVEHVGLSPKYTLRTVDDREVTLFRCQMRSNQKWWFISEADKEQPGTDKDIDYYQHKSKKHQEVRPPKTGWVTSKCDNSQERDPPPNLTPVGIVTPSDASLEPLSSSFASFIVKNNLLGMIFGSSLHREVISRAPPIINFLCTISQALPPSGAGSAAEASSCALTSSDVRNIWETCARQGAMESDEIYKLLAGVLQSFTEDLSFQTIDIIKSTLPATASIKNTQNQPYNDGDDAKFARVSDFVAAVSRARPTLAPNVTLKLVDLIWSTLTSRSSKYMKHKSLIRDYFLEICSSDKETRSKYISLCVVRETTSDSLELFLRLLQVSTQDEIVNLIEEDDMKIPNLLFNDLQTYLSRGASSPKASRSYLRGFSDRLRALRFVYGQSPNVKITYSQIENIWMKEGGGNGVREEIVKFISDCANFNYYKSDAAQGPDYPQGSCYPYGGHPNGDNSTSSTPSSPPAAPPLQPAFNIDVCARAFTHLVCQLNHDQFENVTMSYYESFGNLLSGLNESNSNEGGEEYNKSGTDCLWKIALTAKSDDVVDSAGSRLLEMYSESNAGSNFVSRVFNSMSSNPTASLVTRCMKLLNASASQVSSHEFSTTTSLMSTLNSRNVRAVVSRLPHCVKSNACKKTVTVKVKRLSQQQNKGENGLSNRESYVLLLHPLETLNSVRRKVAIQSGHPVELVKPLNATGKRSKESQQNTPLTSTSYCTTMSELFVTDGTELAFMLMVKAMNQSQGPAQRPPPARSKLDANEYFSERKNSSRYFNLLFNNLENLGDDGEGKEAKALTWRFLQSIQTNHAIVTEVKAAAGLGISESDDCAGWQKLLNPATFHRSVYTMQIIDFLLQPAREIGNDSDASNKLMEEFAAFSVQFRKGFISTGGFSALLRLFIGEGRSSELGMGNAIALCVLKFCLFGDSASDNAKDSLLQDGVAKPLLRNLAIAALSDCQEGYSLSVSHDTVVLDALELLRLLMLNSHQLVRDFFLLGNNIAETLVTKLLLKPGGSGSGGSRVREAMHSLIIDIKLLGTMGFPWLLKCLGSVGTRDDHVGDLFNVLKRLVKGNMVATPTGDEELVGPTPKHLAQLGTAICKKLVELRRQAHGMQIGGNAVLNGCLSLIRRILETKVTGGGEACLAAGCAYIMDQRNNSKSLMSKLASKAEKLSIAVRGDKKSSLHVLIETIFEDFLFTIGGNGVKPICTCEESRRLAFNVLVACAKVGLNNESGDEGVAFTVMTKTIRKMVDEGEAGLRNKFSYLVSMDRKSEGVQSGLRNQGCTCYMNSLLQQLFMMKGLRESLCDAPLPKALRGNANLIDKNGENNMVGKRLNVHWENGNHYVCKVLSFDSKTGMHVVRYDIQRGNGKDVSVGGGNHNMRYHQNFHQGTPIVTVEEQNRAFKLEEKNVELFLTEGRPGKETGSFHVWKDAKVEGGNDGEINGAKGGAKGGGDEVKETESEAATRKLFEELQKTFVHLEKSEKRCFDPRGLVEASACLKLEFDIWQQNDASEYQTKLLDALETVLKKRAPSNAKYLTDLFYMGITKQKICKECGLKTNREEVAVNLEGPVRGRSEILELIEGYCSEELMDGDNKVNCDACNKKTDTVLRTAISKLPKVLTVSLKRFDLDYTTFETVKLNSRMEFGETLNMKKYSLEGFELMDKYHEGLREGGDGDGDEGDDANAVDAAEDKEADGEGGRVCRQRRADSSIVADPLDDLSDSGFEYKLAGVLVHAGVAQGGHYYSFIKDRETGTWFKFDDEDVTPFELSNLENECFGGTFKKESKWPNGTVNMVESERYANALMLFYEKVEGESGDDDAKADNSNEVKEEEKEKEEKGKGKAEVEEESHFARKECNTGREAYMDIVQKDNDTHIRYSYLFDGELHTFLRSIVSLSLNGGTEKAWGLEVLTTSLTFFFNVYLHGTAAGKSLKAWTEVLVSALNKSEEGCVWFCSELAERCRKLSGNWLKQVVSDCMDSATRESGLRVISAGLMGCIQKSNTEKSKLAKWTASWKKQTNSHMMRIDDAGAMPTTLLGHFSQFENLEEATGSSVGVVLGYINQLLEEFVMYFKDGVEFLDFVGFLTKVEDIRVALTACHTVARLSCFLLRKDAHGALRDAYPGSCLGTDAVEVMRGGGVGGVGSHNQALAFGGGGITSVGVDIEGDVNAAILGAIAGCLRVPGCHKEPLLDDVLGTLSKAAEEAFSFMFSICSNGRVGMNMDSIESCMCLCGIDTANVHTYQITSILNKYETVNDSRGDKCLTLRGFLKYHRDTAINSEDQIRNDLNTFGYRRDLTRRDAVQVKAIEGSSRLVVNVGIAEAAALDVGSAELFQQSSLGDLDEIVLNEPLFWKQCFNIDQGLAASCLACAFVGRVSTDLTNKLLSGLLQSLGQWNFTDEARICGIMLCVLANIRDDFQKMRLETICQSKVEVKGTEVGLFMAAREFAMNPSKYQLVRGEQTPAYTYLNFIKRLRESKAVVDWMGEDDRPASWKWMEKWLKEGRSTSTSASTSTSSTSSSSSNNNNNNNNKNSNDDDDDENDDYDDDDDDNGNSSSGNHKNNNNNGDRVSGSRPISGSASGNAINEDFDSDGLEDLGVVEVSGAGVEGLNGRYGFSGFHDKVGKWTMEASINGHTCTSCVFRCELEDRSRRWFISIIPRGRDPGTKDDRDYYTCNYNGEGFYAPVQGWLPITEEGGIGAEPGPLVRRVREAVSLMNLEDRDDDDRDSDSSLNENYGVSSLSDDQYHDVPSLTYL